MDELPPLPAGIFTGYGDPREEMFTAAQLRSFAEQAVKQALAAEREACAKAAEEVDEPGWTGYECPNTFNDGKWAAAAAIRARSSMESKNDLPLAPEA